MASLPINIIQLSKRFLRVSIAYILYYTGILNLLLNSKLKNKAVVLMYHRILDKDEISKSYSQNGIIVSKETFADQMRFLQENLNVISLADTIQNLTTKTPFQSKSCLVTFDDGWKDNFYNAYPILQKNNIPAVIFLPTDFIGSGRHFWQERLSRLLIRLNQDCTKDINYRDRVFKAFQNDGLNRIFSSNQNEVKENLAPFISKKKKQGLTIVDDLIERLEDFLEFSSDTQDPNNDFMNWNEIKTIYSNAIEIGSHGKNHTILTETGVDLDKELLESKTVIESQLNTTINSFSYPNGDCTKTITESVKQYSYDVAFGTEQGFVTHADNPYTLKRINIHEDMTSSMPMFLARIIGLW